MLYDLCGMSLSSSVCDVVKDEELDAHTNTLHRTVHASSFNAGVQVCQDSALSAVNCAPCACLAVNDMSCILMSFCTG